MTLLLAVLAGVLAGPAVVEVSGLLRAKTRKGQRRAGACLPGVRRVRRLAGQVPDDLAGRIEAAQLPRSVDARAVMGLKGLLATIAAVAAFAGASLQAPPARRWCFWWLRFSRSSPRTSYCAGWAAGRRAAWPPRSRRLRPGFTLP